MLINTDLYKNVFGEFTLQYNKLDIVSGYGSSKFLERVLRDHTKLSIRLFLGMTPYGLSQEDHEKYCQLMVEFKDRLKVYYQVTHPATHTKLYKWSNSNESHTLVGSANFSEMAFIGNQQNELLVTTEANPDGLINAQEKNSISCLADDVEDFLKLYESEVDFLEGQVEEILNESEIATEMSELIIEQFEFKEKKYWTEDYFVVPLILKDELNTELKGINGWNGPRGTAYLEQAPSWRFLDAFPNGIFQIVIENKCYDAELSADGRELYFLNGDINHYISDKINLPFDQVITYNDLYNYGNTVVIFEKMSEGRFKLNFPPGNRRLKNVKSS